MSIATFGHAADVAFSLNCSRGRILLPFQGCFVCTKSPCRAAVKMGDLWPLRQVTASTASSQIDRQVISWPRSLLLGRSPSLRRFAGPDRLDALANSDHDDGDQILDHADDPSGRCPHAIVWIFADLTGAANEALGLRGRLRLLCVCHV